MYAIINVYVIYFVDFDKHLNPMSISRISPHACCVRCFIHCYSLSLYFPDRCVYVIRYHFHLILQRLSITASNSFHTVCDTRVI